MKQKLTHNLGLKVLALFCASCLWVIGININDPVTQRVYTVPVRLENLSSLTNAGKYVETVDGTDTVRVTVRASRSVFTDFNEKNISATADVLKITEDDRIPIQVSTTKNDLKIEDVKADKEYVAIRMEDMMKLQKRISVNVQSQPEDGYILGNISTDQNAVIVSGPESVVSRIASTGVEINVDGASSDVNITLPVHLYDADGKTIIDSRLTKSISEVFTTAIVLQKKDVPFEFQVSGEPAEGYLFTDKYDTDREVLTIAGKPAVLKNFRSVVVTEPIDITDAAADVTEEIELKEYLPEGIVLADSKDGGTVTVTAKIEKESDKTVKIDESNFEIGTVPEGYKAEIKGLTGAEEAVFTGMEEELRGINSFNLRGVINLDYLAEDKDDLSGHYYIVPEFSVPPHVRLDKEIKIHIWLEKE